LCEFKLEKKKKDYEKSETKVLGKNKKLGVLGNEIGREERTGGKEREKRSDYNYRGKWWKAGECGGFGIKMNMENVTLREKREK